jgi:hypothetical protein
VDLNLFWHGSDRRREVHRAQANYGLPGELEDLAQQAVRGPDQAQPHGVWMWSAAAA